MLKKLIVLVGSMCIYDSFACTKFMNLDICAELTSIESISVAKKIDVQLSLIDDLQGIYENHYDDLFDRIEVRFWNSELGLLFVPEKIESLSQSTFNLKGIFLPSSGHYQLHLLLFKNERLVDTARGIIDI